MPDQLPPWSDEEDEKPQFRWADELIEEAEREETEPWHPLKALKREEIGYRRGYYHGFVAAIEAFNDMTLDHDVMPYDAYQLLWNFWAEKLGREWMLDRKNARGGYHAYGEYPNGQNPPTFNLRRWREEHPQADEDGDEW